jgi:hypothetical protein
MHLVYLVIALVMIGNLCSTARSADVVHAVIIPHSGMHMQQ